MWNPTPSSAARLGSSNSPRPDATAFWSQRWIHLSSATPAQCVSAPKLPMKPQLKPRFTAPLKWAEKESERVYIRRSLKPSQMRTFAILAGLKWLTWWRAQKRVGRATWRSVAYLFAWPGMDAEAFVDQIFRVTAPTPLDWFWALFKTATGASLIWVVARNVPVQEPLVRGWVGMVGLILLLHFGSFEIVARVWQSLGVDAAPIMSAPLRSTSLSEFWGKRWNLGFRQLSHDLIFRPLKKSWGAGAAGFLVFIVSGLLHESVISLPARGGYGLPTTYFILQGLGVTLERSTIGKQIGLRKGFRGWLFATVVTVGPIFLLFHRVFVLRVILPFMQVIHAL